MKFDPILVNFKAIKLRINSGPDGADDWFGIDIRGTREQIIEVGNWAEEQGMHVLGTSIWFIGDEIGRDEAMALVCLRWLE